MHRSKLLVALAVAGVASFAAPGSAQTPEFSTLIGRYRFLPRHSVLNETGGFPGRDTNYRVHGTFELHDTSRLPTADGFPHFRNVEAWAAHPMLDYVLDLDETLAMSKLIGEQLPVLAPFDVYRFRGKQEHGGAVELFAAVIGPWLHLHGNAGPPPGGADFFEYEIKALARRRPWVDFDRSDVVDRGDLAEWLKNYGAASSLDLEESGDGDGDGDVDGSDFLAWQRAIGERTPPMESLNAMVGAALATVGASATAVPEPKSLALVIAGVAMFAAIPWQSGRRVRQGDVDGLGRTR